MGSSAGQKRLELTLLEELASGTFARVYLAEARGSGGVDRLVAVKVLREKWAESDEVLSRTRDEARLLARLRHKHIVRVEELSELDGQPAIIMEYVEGMDLQQILDRLRSQGSRFPARAALQIGVATASALDAAYRRVPYGQEESLRVVHRDVKPSNVMVSIDGEIKVLDFGTARTTSPLRTAQTGLVRFGSWKYMSPERKEGDRGDHASDIYSLGLLLVELLGSEWIQGLAVSPSEHDSQLRAVVEGVGDLGMPNEAWNAALRDLLLQMSAFSLDVRPSAQQLAEVLRQYADQARGQTVDLLASEVIQDALRAQRQQRTEGALTGTRLFVSLDGAAPPHARRAEASAQPAPIPEDPSQVPVSPQRPMARPADTSPADDFDEPATVVEPFPSPGHYAMGAAQVRFGAPPEPEPAPAQPEPASPTPDPAATWGISASPQGNAAWRPEPSTEPSPLPDFQPVAASQAETEFLPAPDSAELEGAPPQGAPIANFGQPAANYGQPAANNGQPAANYSQPVASFAQPSETAPAPAPAAPYGAAPQPQQPYVASPASAPSPWAAGPVAAGPVAAGPVAAGPVAAGPVAAGPIAPQHSPAPAPRPQPRSAPPKKKKSRLPMVIGGLVLLFLLCAGVPAVGYFGWTFFGASMLNGASTRSGEMIEVPSSPEGPEVVPAPPEEPSASDPSSSDPAVVEAPEESAPAVRGVAVTIQAADRTIRKIELFSADGALVQDSKGSLEGMFPPGDYRLVVKVAGRAPVGEEFTLAEGGLQVACAPDEKMVKVLCKNPEGAIPLVLTGE